MRDNRTRGVFNARWYMDKKKGVRGAWWQPGIVLFARLSSWIVGPILLAVFIGKYLDKKYHSEPWLFLLCTGVSFVVSMIAMVFIGLREFKKIDTQQDQSGKNKNQDDDDSMKNVMK